MRLRMTTRTQRIGLFLVLLSLDFVASTTVKEALSFYDGVPTVQVLSSRNFSHALNNHSRGLYLIEYYSSTCGYCYQFKSVWIRLSKVIASWSPKVVLAAIECSRNFPMCSNQQIEGYPTILHYSDTSNPLKGENIDYDKFSPDKFKAYIVELLLTKSNFKWLSILQYNGDLLEKYIANSSVCNALIVIVERENNWAGSSKITTIGQTIVMDLLPIHERIPAIRVSPKQYQSITGLDLSHGEPMTIFVHYNGTVQKVDRYRSKREGRRPFRTDSTSNWYEAVASTLESLGLDITKLTEVLKVINPEDVQNVDKNKASTAAAMQLPEHQQSFNAENYRVYLADLESCLGYMFQVEIPTKTLIDGNAMQFLKRWISLILRYIPIRPHVYNSLTAIEHLIAPLESESGVTIRKQALNNTPDSYLSVEFHHCKGSKPHFRGYPCSVWLLFHTLTVRYARLFETNRKLLLEGDTPIDIYDHIADYMRYFFTCKECSEHYLAHVNRTRKTIDDQTSLVLAMWKAHNVANKFLSGALTDDPTYPKQQFPIKQLCPNCQENDQWNEEIVYEFLKKYYIPDTSIVLEQPNEISSESPWLALQLEQQKRQNKALTEANRHAHRKTVRTSLAFMLPTIVLLVVIASVAFAIYKARKNSKYKLVAQKTV